MEPDSAKIMVVENHSAIRRPLVDLLRRAGYHADGAENGYLALEKLIREHHQKNAYDLLTTEIFMPGPSGLELIDQIRARGFNLNTLIISGFRDNRITSELQKKGCRHFLDKPFSRGEFLQQVRKLVRPGDRNTRR